MSEAELKIRVVITLSRARSNLSGGDERDPPKSSNWDAREGLKLVGGRVLPGPVLLSYNKYEYTACAKKAVQLPSPP